MGIPPSDHPIGSLQPAFQPVPGIVEQLVPEQTLVLLSRYFNDMSKMPLDFCKPWAWRWACHPLFVSGVCVVNFPGNLKNPHHLSGIYFLSPLSNSKSQWWCSSFGTQTSINHHREIHWLMFLWCKNRVKQGLQYSSSAARFFFKFPALFLAFEMLLSLWF